MSLLRSAALAASEPNGFSSTNLVSVGNANSVSVWGAHDNRRR
jgi:hypothetical protein